MDVGIRVLDANDNSPVFQKDPYFVQVLENTEKYSVIIRVVASDEDAGENGRVTYSLSDQTLKNYNDVFGIDANNGNLFVKKVLDREEQEKYWLYVIASDSPLEGRLTSQVSVVVKLIDLNDNQPQIKLSSDKIPRELSLLSKPGTFVAHFTVNDADHKDNGLLWCWMGTDFSTQHVSVDVIMEEISSFNFSTDPNFSLLRMHPTEYKIVTSRKFSIPDDVNIDFVITCHDKGDPPLTSQESFEVAFVMPDFELETTFKKPQHSVMVQENNKVGAPLMQVELVKRPRKRSHDAKTNDAKRKLYIADRPITDLSAYKFSVTKRDKYTSPVASVNGSGWVIAQISFDRESVSFYNLEVVALIKLSFTAYRNTTSHKPPFKTKSDKAISKTILKIEVQDVDDERPAFQQPEYHFYVSGRSAMTVGSIVGVVKAFDKDSPKYSSITYSLVSLTSPLYPPSEHSNRSSIERFSIFLPFQINPKTGLISLNRRLDYESLHRQSESPYVFNVIASSTFHRRVVHAKAKVHVEYGDEKHHNDVILIDFNSISTSSSDFAKQNPTVYLKKDAKKNDEIVAWTKNIKAAECCVRYRLEQEVVEGQASLDLLTPVQKVKLFNIDPLSGSIKLNFNVATLGSSLQVKLTIILVNDTSDAYDSTFLKQRQSVHLDSKNIRVVYQKYSSHAMHVKQVYKLLSSEKLAVILSVTLVAIFTAILALLVIICLAKLKKMRIYNYNQARANAKLGLSNDNLATTTINANALTELNNDNSTLNKANHNNNYQATYNNTSNSNFLKTSIVDDCLLNDLAGRLPCEPQDDVTFKGPEESMTSLNGLLVGRGGDKKEVVC